MGRRIERGKKGIAAQYVTRSKAIRQLQVNIKDFRRLCILKGIFPRDPPKNPNKGRVSSYYHKKDVLHLSKEPLLNKFREHKIFVRKCQRLIKRKEYSDFNRLQAQKPTMVLDHLIRERYPTFVDALRDLDDPLTLMSLFTVLHSGTADTHTAERAALWLRLVREFNNYVVQAHALKKVFVSVKGYYFQAEVQNQKITWIVPHKFNQHKPKDVDFKVMMTFMDFYEVMAKFVNFKLYHDLGLVYPPAINLDREVAGLGLGSIVNRKVETAEEKQEMEEVINDAEEFARAAGQDFSAQAASNKPVFSGLKFFLGRETPQEVMEFVLASCGAEVVLENVSIPDAISDPSITHQIVDRPVIQSKQLPHREYVQPQWVFDSINMNALLPIEPYGPGKSLPPHLSPFVDDEEEGYVPQHKQILEKWASQDNATTMDKEMHADDEDAQNTANARQSQEQLEKLYVKELAEELGESVKEVETEKAPSKTEETKKDLAKLMMTRKTAYLYNKMQHGIKKRKDANAKLMQKRMQLENQ